MTEYLVGLDVGQVRDPSAVAVVERAEVVGEWDPVMFAKKKWAELRLVHLERMALGTPYPEMTERVRELTRSGTLMGRCRLAVDATGVGRPVVDLLRRAGLGCGVEAVTITGGGQARSEGGMYFVPKRDLITGVQVLLQSGGLRVAAELKEGAALAREMREMRVKVTESGNMLYGAREGKHDDMVLAVSLACWMAKKIYPNPPYGDEAYWRRADQGRWERGLKEWGEERR